MVTSDEYNIFQCLPDGSVQLTEIVPGLIGTRLRLRVLSRSTGREYFAMAHPTGETIFVAEPPALGQRIFQVAYTEELSKDRADLLRKHGFGVLSTVGNAPAKKLLSTVRFRPGDVRCFVVGHAADESARAEMTKWISKTYPSSKVIALNPSRQQLPDATYNVPYDRPELWLMALSVVSSGKV